MDCTEMDQAVREDFLMASRDRVRRNEVYDAIYGTLREELREHAGLREHNAQRRKKRLDETLSKEENTADYLQELLRSDPTLASILGIGGNVVSTTDPTDDPVPYNGRKFPTYFRIVKEPKAGLSKSCSLNRTVRVEFETDADNDYFDCPGSITFDPPNLCVGFHLWNGKFTPKFQMPYAARVGDVVTMTVTVTDIQRDTKEHPFVSRFTLKGTPEAEDTPPLPPGQSPFGTKRNDNGKHSSPVLATPDNSASYGVIDFPHRSTKKLSWGSAPIADIWALLRAKVCRKQVFQITFPQERFSHDLNASLGFPGDSCCCLSS